jgi:TonB-dependent receptor
MQDEPDAPADKAPPKGEAPAGEGDISDEELLEGEENPCRPPPKGKGAIFGVISDTEGPLIEAPVQVVGNKKLTATSDLEGRYRLELPPGTYNLRFSYELHKSVRMDKVVVEAGKVTKLNAQLFTDEEAVDVVEIVQEADKGSLEGMNLSRQRASAVGDTIGRGEISKTPAANAAQAAQRVPGATIVGNRFVYVRGLGERYTNSLLNGAPLPSPEPDRAAIPLDVFPSLIVDSLAIIKTFTPESPADFAGGSVRIQTRELPTKPLFQVSANLGFNDHATFRDRTAQRGSPTDWLGFDNGTRDLPDVLKNKTVPELTPEENLEASQGLNSYMSTVNQFTPPNHGVSFVAGDGWALPNDQRLGALVTMNYGRSYSFRDDGIVRTFVPGTTADGKPTASLANDYTLTYGNDKVNWGTLGQVSYWPSPKHRLSLLGFHSQLADSTGQIVQGNSVSRQADIVNTRLRYLSRALNFGQLRGEHDFPSLANARLEWNGSYAHAGRSEPDTRDTVYSRGAGTSEWISLITPENGSHLHAEQGESSLGGGLDWTQPFSKDAEASKAKVGGLLNSKNRDFKQRRFHYESATFFSCGATYDQSCSDRLYTPENIDSGFLALTEDTTAEDAYKASLDVYAAYGMLDVAVTKDVRLIGGVRMEVTKQELNPYGQFPGFPDLPGSKIDETDFLPALSLAYSPTKKTKLRMAYGRTLARPQIRELAPYAYAPYFGSIPFSGNPNLKLTYINNFDTRFEFYPTLREVLAVSFFFKDFTDPIENIVINSGSSGIVAPVNTPGATLAGVEFEARKSLDSFTPALKDFSAIANLTLAHSQIEIERTGLNIVTSLSRPLVNQAPYVVNFSIDYANDDLGLDIRALYNVSGKKVVRVGSQGIPDSYEQPKHLIDVTAAKDIGEHFSIKLTATNLLASDTIVTLGPENKESAIESKHVVPQSFENVFYDDSRVFTVSASYTY